MKKQLFFAFLCILTMLLSVSCRKPAPPPPKIRMELVLDIFDSLRRSDHKNVLAKLERLRELDKTNVFLSEFESIEKANIKIKEAEAALMRNDRARAETAIREALHMIGNVPVLVKASGEIRDLSELEHLAELIARPTGSSALKEDLTKFRTLAKKFQNNTKLLAFAEKYEKQIPVLKQREDRLTLYGMDADRLFFEKTTTSVANTIDSQKKVEQNTNQ